MRARAESPPRRHGEGRESGRDRGGDRLVAGEIPSRRQPEIPPARDPPTLQQLKRRPSRQPLNENGITASISCGTQTTEVELIDARLGAFAGRLQRDRVVEQACFLARGDSDGFEARFGKLGG